jgi:hypothetical protein
MYLSKYFYFLLLFTFIPNKGAMADPAFNIGDLALTEADIEEITRFLEMEEPPNSTLTTTKKAGPKSVRRKSKRIQLQCPLDSCKRGLTNGESLYNHVTTEHSDQIEQLKRDKVLFTCACKKYAAIKKNSLHVHWSRQRKLNKPCPKYK